MKSLFLLFFLSVNCYVFSSDDPPTPSVNIEASVSSLVDGCVNAITGDFIDSSNDIVVVGPEPLVFERFSSSSDYAANNFCSGWRHNHDTWIARHRPEDQPKILNLTYIERSGRISSYQGKELSSKSVNCAFNLERSSVGLTNCGSGEISAKTNVKNTHIEYNHKNIFIPLQNGSTLHFNEYSRFKIFDLTLEKKANKRNIVYSHDKHHVTDVKLTDEQIFQNL